MFDITPSITLNKTQAKYYKFTQFGLFIVFVLFSFLFIKELIFPTQSFQFNSAVDSLANTISRPYETPQGTGFHISAYGESDAIKISLTLPKDTPNLPKNTDAMIRKSYLSFLAPINNIRYTDYIVNAYTDGTNYFIVDGEVIKPLISKNAFDSYLFKNVTDDITSETLADIAKSKEYVGFANATLISSKDSIYVTDGTTKHPLQDERAFEAMGYNYDNVIKTTSEERALHKKAKLFTVRSAHPFGTIFYAEDVGHTYIYDNDKLNKIPTTKVSTQHAIVTQEQSRDTIASCVLKKHPFSHTYSCVATLDDIKDFDGNAYQVILGDAPSTDIKTINIKLFTTPNDTSLSQRIQSIKRRLNTIYN